MRGSGSRRLMANPCAGDKCASAIAAMRVVKPAASCARAGQGRPARRLLGLAALAMVVPCRGRLLAFGRNFLRSLPCRPLASASLEHSSDSALRGFSAFFSAGAILVAGAGVAGAVVCANAELISSRDANAVAADAGGNRHHGKHLGLKRSATSRRDAEPWMNEADRACIFAGAIFLRREGCVRCQPPVAAVGWWTCQIVTPPRRPRMTIQAKLLCARCGVGFCRVRRNSAGAGPDRTGVQCEIPGRQDRRHPQRPEVE